MKLGKTEYFCPIMHTCPQWIDVCLYRGCQHPEAVRIREEEALRHARPGVEGMTVKTVFLSIFVSLPGWALLYFMIYG